MSQQRALSEVPEEHLLGQDQARQGLAGLDAHPATLVHQVLRLWIRPHAGRPLTEVEELEIEAGRGIVGDHSHGRLRHVTVVFADDWTEATRRLGRAVDPIARRANVLVSGGGGSRYARSQLYLGPVLLQMKGVVTPCPVMDRAAPGLASALREGSLAGIWGRALEGGSLRIGDALRVA